MVFDFGGCMTVAKNFPINCITTNEKWTEEDIKNWCNDHPDHLISADEIIEKINEGASLSIEDDFLTWVEYL